MENSPVRTCVVGPLFVSLSFSICTGLSNRMPPSHWLLAPVRDRMLNKGPRMIDDVIQRPLFLSVNGGPLPDIHWWIWFWKHVSVCDEAIRGRRKAGKGNENRNLTISANVWGTQVKVIMCDIFIYLNVCFSVLDHYFIKYESNSFQVVNAFTFAVLNAASLLGSRHKVMWFNFAKAENNSLLKINRRAGGVAWAALWLSRQRKGQCLNRSTKSTENPRKQMPQSWTRSLLAEGTLANAAQNPDDFAEIKMPRKKNTFSTVKIPLQAQLLWLENIH